MEQKTVVILHNNQEEEITLVSSTTTLGISFVIGFDKDDVKYTIPMNSILYIYETTENGEE